MFKKSRYDAVIVGSGPNGLSAGIALAQQGCSVLIVEAADVPGGGVRSDELTLPGFINDPCASLFPLTRTSPFLSNLPLEKYGLEWIHSPGVLAHPFDDGTALVVDRSLDCTVDRLEIDGAAYRRLIQFLLDDWGRFAHDLLGPFPFPPQTPITYMRFSLNALRSAAGLSKSLFSGQKARALFAGMAGHSILPLEKLTSGAFGIVISATAHSVGWPFPKKGAGALSQALVDHFRFLDGELVTGCLIEHMDQLPEFRVALFDVSPRSFLDIMGDRLPALYRRTLSRFRYGPGVCKVDYALDGPVPWIAEDSFQAATLHLGGTMEEIALSEKLVAEGKHPEKPYVLVAQTSLFDPTRAPHGKHTLWAYCHVPQSSSVDMTPRIEAQIERFAPGFTRLILARSVRTAVDMERYNPNYVGGDINTGIQDLFQLFTRPAPRVNPYSTPIKNVFLCSSATPPGGGVHGMSGYHAAQAALRRL
jgi:phytoene dehydrogenase-like protein